MRRGISFVSRLGAGIAVLSMTAAVPLYAGNDSFDGEMDALDGAISERFGVEPPPPSAPGNAQTAVESAPPYQSLPEPEPPLQNYYPPVDPMSARSSNGGAWDSMNSQLDRLNSRLQKHVKVSGRYRMAMGVGEHLEATMNEADADLQDRDSHYLFGERLYNTYDPAVYNFMDLRLEKDFTDKLSAHMRIVTDPWSYVATTGDQDISEQTFGLDRFNVNYKWFGASNHTVGEIYRAHFRNIAAFPATEAVDGKVPATEVRGVNDLGLLYRGPAAELDHEFKPIRRAWMDYKEETWHTRVFALAGEEQAMTTDDPLILSNNRDFWQPSPWTARWVPIKVFADMPGTAGVDGSIARGHYSDVEAFNAKTSYGEYLTLLRGASVEADMGRAYFGGMIAAPLSPWEDYSEINNVPGVMRLKHQVTPQWMVGRTYTFRIGMIDREPDAYNQVMSMDTKYALGEYTDLYGQIAGSRDNIDRLSDGNRHSEFGFESDVEGMAYKGGLKMDYDHPDGHTVFVSDFAWMDADFRPHLSQYRALRDDNFWGKHITFHEYGPDLEYFRLGTGLDQGRYVFRNYWKTDMWNERMTNLFDIRHVRDTDSSSFLENVVRDELTYKITPELKAKGFMRWALLPETETDIEPFLNDFTFIDAYNLPQPDLLNFDIDPGMNPTRFSAAGGLQYQPGEEWTFEGSYERTNDIPDFPRGLQNDVFLAATSRDPETPNILIDKVQNFLYGQHVYDLPPYEYFSIIKEKVIWRPQNHTTWTFHAAQNTYKLWGPIDEMVNHQGISLDYKFNEKVSLFMDYTHSYLADVPRLINTQFRELNYNDHHNVYAMLKYKVNKRTNLLLMYGVFGETFAQDGDDHGTRYVNPFSVSEFSLPTVDTENIFRASLEGEF